jgi:hypothetical protein
MNCWKDTIVDPCHGDTAPGEAGLLLWSEITVDMIGPWTLEVGNRTEKFSALMIIDLVTNLVKMVRVNNKTTSAITAHFVNAWLTCYPKPMSCVHDPGSEFIGLNFQDMLHRNNIQSLSTTMKNPQANAICKQKHQSIGKCLRVLQQWNPPPGLNNAHALVDAAFANAMYAMHASFHSGLQTNPGALAFHCNMVMNIPLTSDLTLVQQNQKQQIDQRLIGSNRKCFAYDYQSNQEVLKLEYKPDKLAPHVTGPYQITSLHTNGTITIQLTPHTRQWKSIQNAKLCIQ